MEVLDKLTSKFTKLKVGLSNYVLLDVDHIKQEGNWDCGIASLRMAVRFLERTTNVFKLDEAILKHSLEKSVWTIDLAYLCAIMGIRHMLTTITLGADSTYSEESFYLNQLKTSFSVEMNRVNKLFKSAQERNVFVEKKSKSVTEIFNHIANHNQPVIVLVDDSKLKRICLTESKPASVVTKTPENADHLHTGSNSSQSIKPKTIIQKEEQSNTTNTEESVQSDEITSVENEEKLKYWGHFILVVGFDLKQKEVIFNDPSANYPKSRCSVSSFEKARKSYGTDEDLLFIFGKE
ncbi:protein GUCD1-like isoform X1 [Ciona intestinalis]